MLRVAVCALFVGLSATLMWQALQIQGPAGVYPIVMTCGALVFSGAYLIQQVVRSLASGPQEISVAFSAATIVRAGVFAGIWTAYVMLLPYGGFVVTTWVALVACLGVLKGRVRIGDVLSTALFVLVLAVLMKTVLYVPVPQGWIDRTLDVLLYRMR